jgi:hypothetical protein
VDFPSEYVVKTLSGFSVCYFKNEEHDPDAPPHYHITVPISDDSSLLLTVITSQIENRQKYYERKNNKQALSALVTVTRKKLPFLKRKSVIECNQPQLVRKIDFNRIVDPDHRFKVIARDIPEELKVKIVNAIKASPVVKPFVKKMVK